MCVWLLYMATNRRTGETSGNEERETLGYCTKLHQVPYEDPLIGNKVRMTVMVHRQLDLFKALAVDTVLEVGLLSVEPTHTGRGMQTCSVAGSMLIYVSLLKIW